MNSHNLDKLAALIQCEREPLLERWRNQVRQLPSAKHLDIPTLNDHIPNLLDELSTAFLMVADESIPQALKEGSSPNHGLQRHEDGFDIVEVVAEYNILRECLHDLADRHNLTLQGKAFHIINRVLDGAIGLAVQTFATRQALEVQRRREEYLAFVAHDLRTPLNAIALAARVLELKLPSVAEGVETTKMVRTLRRNVQHLDTLVDRVLKESAHIQTESGVKLELRAFDLWPLVEDLIHDLHPVAGTASTRLLNQIPEELTTFADASLIRRVFQNLVANAIKYTPRGEVILGAREMGEQGAVECWVSDNGAGISEDRLNRIFDKLETDPQSEGGTGLGLAIVKTFVEAHDGKVSFESRQGAGTTFRFTLPGRVNIESE